MDYIKLPEAVKFVSDSLKNTFTEDKDTIFATITEKFANSLILWYRKKDETELTYLGTCLKSNESLFFNRDYYETLDYEDIPEDLFVKVHTPHGLYNDQWKKNLFTDLQNAKKHTHLDKFEKGSQNDLSKVVSEENLKEVNKFLISNGSINYNGFVESKETIELKELIQTEVSNLECCALTVEDVFSSISLQIKHLDDLNVVYFKLTVKHIVNKHNGINILVNELQQFGCINFVRERMKVMFNKQITINNIIFNQKHLIVDNTDEVYNLKNYVKLLNDNLESVLPYNVYPRLMVSRIKEDETGISFDLSVEFSEDRIRKINAKVEDSPIVFNHDFTQFVNNNVSKDCVDVLLKEKLVELIEELDILKRTLRLKKIKAKYFHR